MTTLSLVRPDQCVREPDPNDEMSFLPMHLLFWPIFYAEEVLRYAAQKERDEQLNARNQIQISVAQQTFPESTETQDSCLSSKICRKRFDQLVTWKNPWLIPWYRMGLQGFVVETTRARICHHGECHLCKTRHVA